MENVNRVPEILETDGDFTKKWKSYSVWDDTQIKGFFGEYKWLSNFGEGACYYQELLFPTVEHAYQFAKMRVPKYDWCPEYDVWWDMAHHIKKISPSEVKKWGRTVDLRYDWEQVKYRIMLSCVFSKFFLNGELRQKLLDTGDKYLEELNHWNDQYWGVSHKNPSEGQNKLGIILMKVRDVFRE